jgi:O-antigen ligase
MHWSINTRSTAMTQPASWANFKSLDNTAVFTFAMLFVFSIPWENAIPVPGIGTSSKALGIPLLALWLLQLAIRSNFRSLTTFHLIAGFFIFWCACSLFWAVDPNTSLTQIQTFLQLYLLCLILWTELYSEQRCLAFCQAYVLGAVVVAIFIFINYYEGNVTRWDRRASIGGVDENDIALVISTALPISWLLFNTRINYAGKLQGLLRVINLAFLPAAVTAIIMTGSRGGFVTLIPTAAYIIFTIFSGQISLKKKLLIFPIVAGAIYTVFQYAPTQPLMRIIGTLEHLATRNVSGRWDIWQAGLAAWNSSDFSILFGLGVGGYSSSVGRAAHNTPLSVMVETGAIGIAVFFLILLSLLVAVLKRGRVRLTGYALFSVTLLSVWFIGVLALSWEYRKPTWVIWSILICLAYAIPSNNRARAISSRPSHQ